MEERLLHFIWRSQLFNTTDLQTTTGEQLIIKNVGIHNKDSGPDFLNAKIQIDDQVWAGNVEIHKASSQWYEHGHHTDQRYDTVVLHIVWNHDMTVFNSANAPVPTLVLKYIVSNSVLEKYKNLYSQYDSTLACAKNIIDVPELRFNNWMDRLFVERLEKKVRKLEHVFKKVQDDWEALFYTSITESFGLKVNKDTFFNLAILLPFNVVRKYLHDQKSLEALFFGTAALLERRNNYESDLYQTYEFLRNKYNLQQLNRGQVQFFRLRPSNFPTIRLSQLAALYHNNIHLFAEVMSFESVTEIYEVFQIKAGSFWDTHYTFQAESRIKEKWLSIKFIDLLIINVVIPVKHFYAKQRGIDNSTKLIALMEALDPEKNAVVSFFKDFGVIPENAMETQSLLQLKQNYCDKKRCLECDIGKFLITG